MFVFRRMYIKNICLMRERSFAQDKLSTLGEASRGSLGSSRRRIGSARLSVSIQRVDNFPVNIYSLFFPSLRFPGNRNNLTRQTRREHFQSKQRVRDLQCPALSSVRSAEKLRNENLSNRISDFHRVTRLKLAFAFPPINARFDKK